MTYRQSVKIYKLSTQAAYNWRPASEKWKIGPRRIVTLCNQGRVKGAVKFGNTWAIPDNTAKPEDKRIKSGKYIKSNN